MNYLLKCLFLSCLLISVVACTDGINETVISAYQLPVLPEPSYKFSRNGESSVNVLEYHRVILQLAVKIFYIDIQHQKVHLDRVAVN